MSTGCDLCVWQVDVVTGCSHWRGGIECLSVVWLNNLILLPCFHNFSTLPGISFLGKCFLQIIVFLIIISFPYLYFGTYS